MDSATAAAAVHPPRVRARCGCALNLFLFLAVTASFAGAAYRARHHRPRDLAFVATAYYLLALLLCCVAKLELLRDDPAAGDAQRRRARLAAGAVSVALSVTFSWRVADAAAEAGRVGRHRRVPRPGALLASLLPGRGPPW